MNNSNVISSSHKTRAENPSQSLLFKEEFARIEEKVLDAVWIVDFVDGEGCFHVGINKNKQSRLGTQILPEFTVVQHSRDIQVFERLKQFFGCGVVRINNGDRLAFRVRKIQDLVTTIIPFFDKHPLQTRKKMTFYFLRGECF